MIVLVGELAIELAIELVPESVPELAGDHFHHNSFSTAVKVLHLKHSKLFINIIKDMCHFDCVRIFLKYAEVASWSNNMVPYEIETSVLGHKKSWTYATCKCAIVAMQSELIIYLEECRTIPYSLKTGLTPIIVTSLDVLVATTEVLSDQLI